jgi:leucyl-tRNA synthetase
MPRYIPAEIEPKWQAFWETNKTFAAPRVPSPQKKYILDMFPYPSGDGLHVGHPEGYTATDIVSRFERMRGTSVLHPMGFDSFGLPAEEYAIKNNVPPRVSTDKNIANFIRQLKSLGFSYDWDRCLATTDIEYVRWTQWIFLVLFDTWFDAKSQRGRPISELPIPADVQAAGEVAVARYQDEHRLALIKEAPVNWCPALGTVLANEEVIDGRSERGDHPVVRLPLKQWMLRITHYAERLEAGLDALNWPDSIKKLQRDWIGKSTGAEVDFYIGKPEEFESWKAARTKSGFPAKPARDVLRVYTTRPDTLFGATYMVIAPEHAAVTALTTPEQKAAVEAYVQQASFKSDLDRTELAKTKTGVFTGSYAINPVNGEKVPVWIADYVLASYGTGAIMAVPAHDERDYEFAKVFGLPIIPVVDPGEAAGKDRDELLTGVKAFIADGLAINSGSYEGLATPAMKLKITTDLANGGLGREAKNFKLRDWLFSRQRFWGEPFPILHELDANNKPTGRYRAVPVDQLPVKLPELADFKPHGKPEPPLEKADDSWLYVTLDGKRYKRETNTMPQWAGSCWYFLRYIDKTNETRLVDPELEKAWMPVDLYIGGAEHAVLHLLYARFWHLVLFDRGHVSTSEPFTKLVNQGMILGEAEYSLFRYDRNTDLNSYNDAFVRLGILATVIPAKEEGERDRVILKAAHAAGGKPGNLTPEHVEKRQGKSYLRDTDIELSSQAEKMSKSRGNVVNPDSIIEEFGADSMRLYEMFMGPLEATKPWSTNGVHGVRGFLDRVWRLIVNDKAEAFELHAGITDAAPDEEQLKVVHRTIAGVTHDIQTLSFNTAIAKLMEFTNFFTKSDKHPRFAMETLLLLLSPFAPHLAEELWEKLGHTKTLAYEPWPVAEERYLHDDTVEIPVQVNGKLRARVMVPADSTADSQQAVASADSRIAELLAGKSLVKVVSVPGKLVNFVIKP